MRETRTYSDELKAEAVKMILEQGFTRSETAKKLMIPSGTIGIWVALARNKKEPALPGDESYTDLIAENNRLRKELARVSMERDILKKATAYFAKETLTSTH